VLCIGLAFGPLGALPWVIVVLTATAWITVLQRTRSVRAQLRARETDNSA
jgi:hypothetical protein